LDFFYVNDYEELDEVLTIELLLYIIKHLMNFKIRKANGNA